MSSSKKFLINGCGYTYWKKARFKTWAKIFALLPHPSINLALPAISNQWILDETFYALADDPHITDVIIQLTALGKLDVEFTSERQHMIESDTLRNFVYDGIWPSSHSQDHESKKYWKKYLWSPKLETKELCAKIVMLDTWCKINQKKFFCYQAYPIAWDNQQKKMLTTIIKNLDQDWNTFYQHSDFYKSHDHSQSNTVPCWDYHVFIARTVAQDIGLNIADVLERIQ